MHCRVEKGLEGEREKIGHVRSVGEWMDSQKYSFYGWWSLCSLMWKTIYGLKSFLMMTQLSKEKRKCLNFWGVVKKGMENEGMFKWCVMIKVGGLKNNKFISERSFKCFYNSFDLRLSKKNLIFVCSFDESKFWMQWFSNFFREIPQKSLVQFDTFPYNF